MIIKKLSDICLIQSGGTPSRSKQEYWNDGSIPWVKISDFDGKYLTKTSEHITEHGLQGSSTKLFKKGTILYTIFATLGEVCILDIDATTNQAIAGLSLIDETVLKDYLYYYLVSLKQTVNEIGRGVAQNNINMSILKNMSIPIPSIEEQYNIISNLESLSTLITARREQLSKLDELVKSRFVELFDSANNSKISKLNDVCEEITAGGDRPKDTSEIKTEEYPYPVFANAATNEGLLCFSREYKVEKPCVTIAARGCTVGFTAIRTEKFTPVVRLISLIPNEDITPIYLKHYIDIKMCIEGNGAAQPQLTIPMIKNMEIMVPPIELQNRFATFVAQTDKSKLAVQQGLEKLETLKKALMQKYFG